MPLKPGDFISADMWRGAVLKLPQGTEVTTRGGVLWVKMDGCWECEGIVFEGDALNLSVTITRLDGQEAEDESLPGHTCPNIDKAQRLFNRIAWWASQRPEEKATIRRLVNEGHEVLEKVRGENAQMRAAYWSMKKKEPSDAAS